MKIIRALSLITFFLCSMSLYTHGETKQDLTKIKHPIQPMLWKVEGKGLQHASYLFGSIHVADKRVTNLHPDAQKAFDAADTLYTEVELSIESQLKSAHLFFRKDKKSLREVLGADLYNALEVELKAINPKLTAKEFNRIKLSILMVMLSTLDEQMLGLLPLDQQLWTRAEKAGKKLGALETSEDQFAALGVLTIEEEKELLRSTLLIMKKCREKKILSYQGLLDPYLRGDCDAVDKFMKQTEFLGVKSDKAITAKLLEALLYKRNRGMAQTIDKKLSSSNPGVNVFVAGIGHFVGERSVVDLLRKKGYTVTLQQSSSK